MSNKMTRDPLYLRSSSMKRRVIRSVLGLLGLSYSRASKRHEILSFFQLLWPVRMRRGLFRLGPQSDGGYLLPVGMGDFDAIFSPGVADNWGAESAYLQKHPATQIYMADGSVDEKSLGPLPERVEFIEKFIGPVETQDCLDFASWVCDRYSGSDALLTMDIEGQEYEILASLPDSVLGRFKCIVIEMHGLQLVGSREGLAFLESTIRRLLHNFDVAHFHGNNYANTLDIAGLRIPPVGELTLVRKDLGLSSDLKVDNLPHELDVSNCDKPDFSYMPHFSAGILR